MDSMLQMAVSLNTNNFIKLDGILKIEPRITVLYTVNTDNGILSVNYSEVWFRGTVYDLQDGEGDNEDFNVKWKEGVKNQYNLSSLVREPFSYIIDSELPQMGYILSQIRKDALAKEFYNLISKSKWTAYDFNFG